jgi:colanic acid/amylovoran biosynthesis glycosyltransferase
VEPTGTAEADFQPAIRLAYLTVRFPETTETFVIHELNHVAADAGIDARLFSVLPPSPDATIHDSARPWLHRVETPSLREAVAACLRWSVAKPFTVAGTFGVLVSGFGMNWRRLRPELRAALSGCALAKRMQRERIEHVHAHFVGQAATAAWVVRRLTGIEYTVTAHAFALSEDRAFFRRRVRDAGFVVTISRFNANFIFRYCRGITPPIFVVRAGIDLSTFDYRERTLPSHGPIRTLAIGSLLAYKGHRILIEALDDPDAVIQRLELAIVGDGPERGNLEAEIGARGLGDRVKLLGSLPENEIAMLLGDADLFVLPSLLPQTGRMEGIPVVLMEALASGVPVIASRLAGIPELIEPGVTGTLAEEGDPVSLRDAIRQIVTDPAAARTMAAAGRRRVEHEFDVRESAEILTERFRAARPVARQSEHDRRPAFIAWSHSARSREMAIATGARCHAVFIARLGRKQEAPLRYVLSAVSTTSFLLRARPSVVVATNPPIFPALIAYILAPLTRSVLVLDSHPRGFGFKDSAVGRLMLPIHRYLVRRARATLVASSDLADIVRSFGGRPLIIHEAPPGWSIDRPPILNGRPSVLWVTIFAADEPVATVLDAARLLPDVTFVITGDAQRCPESLRAAAPSNVTFTGFWVDEGYSRLIAASHVMLVLTTESSSVPRAALEAVEGLRPLVMSDFPGLHDLFPEAVFVQNTATAIAGGIRDAIGRHAELVTAGAAARDRQRERWGAQLQLLLELLATDEGGGPNALELRADDERDRFLT